MKIIFSLPHKSFVRFIRIIDAYSSCYDYWGIIYANIGEIWLHHFSFWTEMIGIDKQDILGYYNYVPNVSLFHTYGMYYQFSLLVASFFCSVFQNATSGGQSYYTGQKYPWLQPRPRYRPSHHSRLCPFLRKFCWNDMLITSGNLANLVGRDWCS